MPVIEVIENMGMEIIINGRDISFNGVIQFPNGPQRYEWKSEPTYIVDNAPKLIRIFDAVIEFIKWYNLTSKKQNPH